ncbi:MAG: diaminopimelate epimerase [Ferruginibacter sp.]|nr:diaminopimelate epimerase [Ferruginibacter sp.]
MKINFFKYQGTGNDFVILDNRTGIYDFLTKHQVQLMCDRKFGVGGDGLMLLNSKQGYDFEMLYYNSDGSQSTMCGNGGRCMVCFAYHLGIHKYTYRFLAIDGVHEAEIDMNNQIRLKMNDVTQVDEHSSYAVLNTGSPHFIKFASDVANIDVVETGRDIRNSKPYAAEGINVSFVENLGEDRIFVRTYERGVEDETLSCGTGVTAAALVSAHNPRGFNRVEVKTPGGNLSVEYTKIDENNYENIWLCGPAELVFSGETNIIK